MDLALEPLVRVVEGQASPLGAQVGVVVRAKENVVFAAFTGGCPEESTHVGILLI